MARDLGGEEETNIEWLPELVLLEDYGGSWERYFEVLHSFFKEDFVVNKPVFQGRRLALKRHPMTLGKEVTFWHLISEGQIEADRTPDLRRCERIRWPRPIINNSNDNEIRCWENTRKGEKRICLWLFNHDYLVILAERKGYLLLWTAYIVERSHQKRKLQKEYEKYKNTIQ
jgi:hypothetical protein